MGRGVKKREELKAKKKVTRRSLFDSHVALLLGSLGVSLRQAMPEASDKKVPSVICK